MNGDKTGIRPRLLVSVHRRPKISLGATSEQQLQPKLNAPRAFRRLNLPEGGRAHENVGQIQIHVIHQVECLGAELQTGALAQARGLEDGYVDVLKSRAGQYVPPGIAEAAE